MNASTTEEQQAAKKVDQAVLSANADIDNAAANTDVDNVKLQMKLQSQPLHLMQMLNQQRNKQLLQSTSTRETAIDANNGATTEKKAAAKQQVQTEKQQLIQQLMVHIQMQKLKRLKMQKLLKLKRFSQRQQRKMMRLKPSLRSERT